LGGEARKNTVYLSESEGTRSSKLKSGTNGENLPGNSMRNRQSTKGGRGCSLNKEKKFFWGGKTAQRIRNIKTERKKAAKKGSGMKRRFTANPTLGKERVMKGGGGMRDEFGLSKSR